MLSKSSSDLRRTNPRGPSRRPLPEVHKQHLAALVKMGRDTLVNTVLRIDDLVGRYCRTTRIRERSVRIACQTPDWSARPRARMLPQCEAQAKMREYLAFLVRQASCAA